MTLGTAIVIAVIWLAWAEVNGLAIFYLRPTLERYSEREKNDLMALIATIVLSTSVVVLVATLSMVGFN